MLYLLQLEVNDCAPFFCLRFNFHFERMSSQLGTYTEVSKLVGTGAIGSAYQGWSVKLSEDGNFLFVGAYLDNSLGFVFLCLLVLVLASRILCVRYLVIELCGSIKKSVVCGHKNKRSFPLDILEALFILAFQSK